jgi:tRNA (mo5U34)-methyltransferase
LVRTGRRQPPATEAPAEPVLTGDPAERARLQVLVASVPTWFHSLDLGHGVVTPGQKTPAYQRAELELLRLPDLRGKSVLDIGAWDGFYSFEAERRGASRVVALDHFAWSVSPLELAGHPRLLALEAVPWERRPEEERLAALPGKKGFDTARLALGSRVEAVVDDFMTLDLERLGTFDVVFYLGVLYHMKEPFQGLRRLAAVTRELAVIETASILVAGSEDIALCEFYETNELNGDRTNWWAPNAKALAAMARAAGFRAVDIIAPPLPKDAKQLPIIRHRLIAHAWK